MNRSRPGQLRPPWNSTLKDHATSPDAGAANSTPTLVRHPAGDGGSGSDSGGGDNPPQPVDPEGSSASDVDRYWDEALDNATSQINAVGIRASESQQAIDLPGNDKQSDTDSDMTEMGHPELVSMWDENALRMSKHGIGMIRGHSGEDFIEIAHSTVISKNFDNLRISWAVQWQIGMLIAARKIQPNDVTAEKLEALCGSNEEAGPKVAEKFVSLRSKLQILTSRFKSQNPWIELDKEEHPDIGYKQLGLKHSALLGEGPEEMGDWWGGHIEQRAVLLPTFGTSTETPPTYRVELRQHEYRTKSHRLARKFGSRRFIQLKLPDLTGAQENERNQVKDILSHGFVLHGRIFRAFCGHDGLVHLIETNENFERRAVHAMGDFSRPSFSGFIDSFNSMDKNESQLVCKWRARFTLGLSTSIPALIFRKSNIFYIPDIVSARHTGDGKPDAKHVMTDGCGKINMAALRLIQLHRNMFHTPTAIQGRIAGAKGLWVLDPFDDSVEPKIWITESQVKIKYTDTQLEEPANRILDLLRLNQTKNSSTLSNQPIINFAHNGVPNYVFTEMLREGLAKEVDRFVEQWREDDVLKVWDAVFRRGALSAVRRAREERAELRLFGFEPDSPSSLFEENVDLDTLVDPFAMLPGPDPYSGWPSEPPAEQVAALLESGFTPRTCPILARDLKVLMRAEVQRMTRPCRIPVIRSAEVFAVPDFLGVLEAGEVYFRASPTGLTCPLLGDRPPPHGVLTGRVIIFRYPARTPSDCQLVSAVDRAELLPFTDVLIFSTKGDQSGVSMLAGGDYDGDTVHIVTEPRLVDHFHNADPSFSEPPRGFDEFIQQSTRSVKDLRAFVAAASASKRAQRLQKALIEDCTKPVLIGLYSYWADLATWHYGYNHYRTHRTVYKFYNELDSIKSGKHVIAEVFENDQLEFGRLPTPTYLKKADGQTRHTTFERPPRLGEFVLDALTPFAAEQEEIFMRRINDLSEDREPDGDLLAAYRSAENRAGGQIGDSMRAELSHIEGFVQLIHQEWTGTFTGASDNSPHKRLAQNTSLPARSEYHEGSVNFNGFPKRVKRAATREVSRRFDEEFDAHKLLHFSPDEARNVMASYAYHLAVKSRSRNVDYAFSVAFKELAYMKSKASGMWRAINSTFSNNFVPRPGLSRE